jgi:hypothetical protein
MKKYLSKFDSVAEATAFEGELVAPHVSYVENQLAFSGNLEVDTPIKISLNAEGKLEVTVVPAPVEGPADNEIWYKIDSNENIQIFCKLNTTVDEIFYDDDKKYNIVRTLDPITEIKGDAWDAAGQGLRYSFSSFGHKTGYDSWEYPPESGTHYPVKEIWLPECIKTLGFYAFRKCEDLLKINLPKSIEYIQQDVFADYHLVSNNNYKYIEDCIISGTDEFKNNQFAEIEIGKDFRLIGEKAFYDCKFEKVTVSDSVRYINGGAFGNCQNLTSIKLPANSILTGESVANGDGSYLCPSVGTFEYCPSLQDVHLPVNITSITNRTFLGCSSLTNIVYAGTKAQWEMIPKDSNWFYGDNHFIETITCTDGVLTTSSIIEYTSINEQIMSDFYDLGGNVIRNTYENGKGKIVLDRVITTIESGAFSGCPNLRSITIPNSVTSIGENAFSSCFSLTSITIPNSVTSIGKSAFQEGFELTSIMFEGTMAEWNAITKGSYWNDYVPATYVQCTDGQVTI